MKRTRIALSLAGLAVLAACGSDAIVDGSGDGGATSSSSSGVTDAGQDSSTPTTTDAGPTKDGGAGKDAADPTDTWAIPTAPPDCDLNKPFEAGTKVAFPYGYERANIILSPDELTALFLVDNGISKTERASRSVGFGKGTPVLTGPSQEFENVGVSADGLTIVMEAFGAQPGQIVRATRTSVKQNFGKATVFLNLAPPWEGEQPFLRADGKEIFGLTNRGADDGDIFFAPITNGVVGATKTIAGLRIDGNSAHRVSSPVLSFDGLTLYFTRAGGIMTVKRASTSSAWSTTAEGIPALAFSPGHIQAPYFASADGCRLYYSTSADVGLNLWVSSRGK